MVTPTSERYNSRSLSEEERPAAGTACQPSTYCVTTPALPLRESDLDLGSMQSRATRVTTPALPLRESDLRAPKGPMGCTPITTPALPLRESDLLAEAASEKAGMLQLPLPPKGERHGQLGQLGGR